jgi:hypothetical protein
LEYEVKEILDSKIVHGKLRYYVDWVGYSPIDRTWEPAEHLCHAKEALAEFHARYPGRPSPNDIPPRRSSEHRRGLLSGT